MYKRQVPVYTPLPDGIRVEMPLQLRTVTVESPLPPDMEGDVYKRQALRSGLFCWDGTLSGACAPAPPLEELAKP